MIFLSLSAVSATETDDASCNLTATDEDATSGVSNSIINSYFGNNHSESSVYSEGNYSPAGDTVEVVPPILKIKKTANVTVVGNNTLVEFTIIVNNTSIVDATDVGVKDGLPSVFEFVNATEGYDTLWNEWIINCIPAGESVTFTIIGRSSEIFNYTNYAYALCNEIDTYVVDTFKGQIVPTNLTIVKSAGSNVTVGENVTFTITITNNGPINVTDVSITDALDSTFRFDGASTSVPCIVFENELVWNIGDIASMASKTITFNVTTIAVGNFTNEATVTCRENSTGKSDRTDVTVNPGASLVRGENVTVTYGDDIIIDYNSTNATGITYAIFDDKNNLIFGDTVGPNGSIAVDWLAAGKYTVNWTSVVDGNHTLSTATSTITVNPAPSTVQAEDISVNVGDSIVVHVTSENATEITYEIIDGDGNVVDDGAIRPGEDIVPPSLPAGKYVVNLTALTDSNHTSSANTSTIEIADGKEQNATSQAEDSKPPVGSALTLHETANPILALLMALALLGIRTKRKK
ncbi:hypothetical protein TL18_05235 [Methanobrevibacter sp. YE315]|uniref:DUF11 domain-containing protein n=1 Tax=Methanobrevibacter sp. YE315 TaxID=1609968 RepID=UPI000764EC6C|nr:DUF11 domain-containing protein [Methanobrevibacter sp. YE315]AMD17473.1 hypothetical protein TL18_05235 [Methanobrevibacter sp. YE315]